jgi:glutaconyl-CoA/methylmalonyl-CoA decarboxylase subunit gamma
MKINLQIQGKKYTVSVGDIHARPIKAEVDGEEFEVWPQEMETPERSSTTSNIPGPVLSQPAAVKPVRDQVSSGSHSDQVQAPIPGVIVDIKVKPGDKVGYGKELCVLEAMKMKNSIRANRDGIIKAVHAKIGEHVHQSQLLVEFESGGDA